MASEGLRTLYQIPPSARFDADDFISLVHPEDRAKLREVLAGARSSQLPPRVRYRLADNDEASERWHQAELEASGGGDDALTTATVHDVTQELASERAVIESKERLRLAMEAGRLAIYEIELNSGLLIGSAELNRLYGLPPDARPTLADLRSHYAPGELARLEKEGVTHERARDSLQAQRSGASPGQPEPNVAHPRIVEAEVTIITPMGVTKHLDYRAQYVAGNDGVQSRMIGVLVDVSDRKRAEDRLTVVASELHHRINNALAIVQAIASQTFRSVESAEASLRVFLARLRALASATSALLEENANTVSIENIVQRITAPYRSSESDPFSLQGDPVAISGELVTSLALALHELSTNAVKYGALSVPEGRVLLSWSFTEGGMLELRWEEKGGPPVTPPARKGFGTRLLSTLIPYGSVVQEFAPGGLICVVRCKVNH